MHLDPLAADLPARTAAVARRLERLGLGVTVETGARYVLDPRRKHGPSLLDPDAEARATRTRFLLRAVRVAADLGAHALHCFSGITPPATSDATAWKRLTESLTPVLEAASAARVPLAVEPEPGHLLATLDDFHHLRGLLGDPAPDVLGLTLDLGHCQCLEPLPPADCVRAAAPWIRHIQIEDMRRGVHEHLPFGDGEIDFPPLLDALTALAAGGYPDGAQEEPGAGGAGLGVRVEEGGAVLAARVEDVAGAGLDGDAEAEPLQPARDGGGAGGK
ncbi:sugar phosphate isomerase/epimerase family protein, partial [Streptomyces sp. MS191]|uniref:sugar phosphate isomerase/epimerase family protein n=1 Tax=Streptomyces sp. ms191 TaxID=1827978 RepID=UPI0021C7F355